MAVVLAGSSASGGAEPSKTTTIITSKTLTASDESNKAVFKGSVRMVQDELVVLSDMMIVYFKDKKPRGKPASNSESQSKEIKVIEAKGRVRIAKGESRAIAKRALYFKDEEKVVLQGSPVAWQEGTRISGPKMTMYLKENRSVVEGGTKVIIEQPPE